MNIGEQAGQVRSCVAKRYAKRVRAKAVRRLWRLKGETIPNGRYRGWVD
jgi:hypothetical protein